MSADAESESAQPLPSAESEQPVPNEETASHTAQVSALVLSHDGTRRGLESMTELLAQAAERAAQKEALFGSIADDLSREDVEVSQLRSEVSFLHDSMAEVGRRHAHETSVLHTQLLQVRHELEEAKAMRAREVEFARQSSGSRHLLEKAVGDADAELARLRHALESEQARCASAEGSRQAQAEEHQRELAAVRDACAAELTQQKALSSGVRLKNKKLEADVQQERLRADAAACEAAEAKALAARLEAQAARAEEEAARMHSQVAGSAQESHSREAATRKAADAKLESLRAQLNEALRACEVARVECTKVRERNYELEEELAQLRAEVKRCGGDTGGPKRFADVLDSLEQMETMLDPAASKEAERRLRERAKRVNANEVASRLS